MAYKDRAAELKAALERYYRRPRIKCPDCGIQLRSPRATKCRSCHKRGSSNPNWKGDSIIAKSGDVRALRAFPESMPCERCGADKSERHHKDHNTRNNDASNIARLCRRCHMLIDGRLANMKALRQLQLQGTTSKLAATAQLSHRDSEPSSMLT